MVVDLLGEGGFGNLTEVGGEGGTGGGELLEAETEGLFVDCVHFIV